MEGETVVYDEDEIIRFQRECLRCHNYLRNRHGCPNLRFNPNLCSEATRWAKEMAREGYACYKTEFSLGQNVKRIKIENGLSAWSVTNFWYSFIQYYDFNQPRYYINARSFIQLIWKSTVQVGFGVEIANQCYFIVAFYYPPCGGYDEDSGIFQMNVPQSNIRLAETFMGRLFSTISKSINLTIFELILQLLVDFWHKLY